MILTPHIVSDIRNFLSGEERVLVVTHFNPDGDAIGCLLAFGGLLDQLHIPHLLAVDDICPEKYAFLPGFERIRNLKEYPPNERFQRVVILDAGSMARIGSAQHCIGSTTQILNIDHHYTGKAFGTINVIDVEASSTAELLYDLCIAQNVELNDQIKLGLLVGIVSDTGRFRFANTTPRAMKICGELMERGVDIGLVTEKLYYSWSWERIRALGETLATMESHYNGLVGLIHQLNGDAADTEGFIEYVAAIDGVVLSAFIGVVEQGVFKVSLRSNCVIDVSSVARHFKGGGHLKAAGFQYEGEYEVLKRELLEELKDNLTQQGLLMKPTIHA